MEAAKQAVRDNNGMLEYLVVRRNTMTTWCGLLTQPKAGCPTVIRATAVGGYEYWVIEFIMPDIRSLRSSNKVVGIDEQQHNSDHRGIRHARGDGRSHGPGAMTCFEHTCILLDFRRVEREKYPPPRQDYDTPATCAVSSIAERSKA